MQELTHNKELPHTQSGGAGPRLHRVAGQWMGLFPPALTVFWQPSAAVCTLLIPCSDLPGLI